ncbi:MAG: hypothetical protein EZS28_007023 [Streblomastix strix]|uniref:Uncharacterized protein n=1 Tax=Streblomastix strix TaxID=222440 RepID=A0A5J4WTJ0_9EUKA|nr:MAG: hypothetical protein EZS28_007023 [Streblomastix strix]
MSTLIVLWFFVALNMGMNENFLQTMPILNSSQAIMNADGGSDAKEEKFGVPRFNDQDIFEKVPKFLFKSVRNASKANIFGLKLYPSIYDFVMESVPDEDISQFSLQMNGIIGLAVSLAIPLLPLILCQCIFTLQCCGCCCYQCCSLCRKDNTTPLCKCGCWTDKNGPRLFHLALIAYAFFFFMKPVDQIQGALHTTENTIDDFVKTLQSINTVITPITEMPEDFAYQLHLYGTELLDSFAALGAKQEEIKQEEGEEEQEIGNQYKVHKELGIEKNEEIQRNFGINEDEEQLNASNISKCKYEKSIRFI